MSHPQAVARLLPALAYYDIELLSHSEDEDTLELSGGYTVEVEGPTLYKLLSDGAVVAPFSDIDELCQFIKADQAYG